MTVFSKYNNNSSHSDYFDELIDEVYPNLLTELEVLKPNVVLLPVSTQTSQLLIEKLIGEIGMMARVERHYWQEMEEEVKLKKFPKEYIHNKQNRIKELLAQLRNLFFSLETTAIDFGKEVFEVLKHYIDIEFNLNLLLIEKQKRIFDLTVYEAD